MNTVTFLDPHGNTQVLPLYGFVYRGQFYGRVLSQRGWEDIDMPLDNYLKLLGA